MGDFANIEQLRPHRGEIQTASQVRLQFAPGVLQVPGILSGVLIVARINRRAIG
jgi:hypothetical protein